MEKNKYLWIIVLIIGLAIAAAIYFFTSNNSGGNQNNYEADRTSTNSTSENKTKEPEYVEETISTFATKIYNSDPARQNNINITCSKLNQTIVADGATFSFCDTIGPSTSAKGYQEADIFDSKGNMKKGLGGGNCQISSTLYNAVLAVPSLSVTERHAHSNYVPYIEKGKDAAVAYGSYDLKFVNNTGNELVIYCSSDGVTVNVSLASKKTV